MHSLSVNDLYKNEYIIMKCKTVRLKMNAYVMILDVLDQLTFKKLSNELRTNCWKLYKMYTDIIRSLIVLSVCVLRIFV